jgi:hypothetical protein
MRQIEALGMPRRVAVAAPVACRASTSTDIDPSDDDRSFSLALDARSTT